MKLLSCVVVAVLAGGCGDDGGGVTPCEAGTCEPEDAGVEIDAPPDAKPTCNPLAAAGQQGCTGGQKCAWITTQETPTIEGVLDCVVDGTVDPGGTCTQGPVGATTGFDDCKAGSTCVKDKCTDICGLGANASAPNAGCTQGHACAPYAGLFEGDELTYGACEFRCNPVTQQLEGGGICPVDEGCYFVMDAIKMETITACAAAATLTHGMVITGTVYANSCAPGHAPRSVGPGLTARECGALCIPTEVTTTTGMTMEGGVSPHTCVAKGASPPDNATSGESCRFFHNRESGWSSYLSNTIGHCYKHAIWQYDSNGDMIVDAPAPRCINVTHADTLYVNGADDAVDFACAPKPLPVPVPPLLTEPVQSYRFQGWRR